MITVDVKQIGNEDNGGLGGSGYIQARF